MRRIVWVWLAAVVALGAAGCSGHRQPSASKRDAVALVTDVGGIDDRSFNAASWEGLKRAQTELGVQARQPLESHEQADYTTNLAMLADQGYGLVFAVGYLMEDALKEVAPKYPNTKFAIIDGSAPNLPNCVSLKFREEEGCVLAGYLAARMSRTGAIGFVGGIESPQLKKFECGYHAGALMANRRARVIAKYVGDFRDSTKGQLMAEEELRQGADIVFAAAGKSGLGALDAVSAKGPGFYGIGVDADQDGIHQGRILTSMMKGVDTAVFDTVKQFRANAWRPGEHVLGIKEGGVHLSPMRYTAQDVPQNVKDELAKLSEKLAAGAIKAPRNDAELAAFRP